MAVKKSIIWKEVRAAYEAGATVVRLAQVNNIKAAAIRERAAAERWGPNAGEELFKAAQERKRAERERRLTAAGALAGLSIEQREALVQDLLIRYLQGDTPYTMAKELGTTRNVLYYVLLGGADDAAHHGLITQALTARVARADEMLENAKGPVEIARAREMARFARMDYERRRPSLYGQQGRIDLRLHVSDLGERLRRARERVVPSEGHSLLEVKDDAQPVEESDGKRR